MKFQIVCLTIALAGCSIFEKKKGSSGGPNAPQPTPTAAPAPAGQPPVSPVQPAASSGGAPKTAPLAAPSEALSLQISGVIDSGEIAASTRICTAESVVLVNTDDQRVPAPTTLNVALTSTSTTGSFFSDQACSSNVSNISISTGQSSAQFYYMETATVPNNITLTAAAPNGSAIAAGSLSMQASADLILDGSAGTSLASSTKWTFPALGITVAIGSCTRMTPEPVYYNNEVTVNSLNPVNVTFSTTSSNGGFFSDAACTQPSNSVLISRGFVMQMEAMYYKDTVAETSTVSVTETPAQGWASGSMTVTAQ